MDERMKNDLRMSNKQMKDPSRDPNKEYEPHWDEKTGKYLIDT